VSNAAPAIFVHVDPGYGAARGRVHAAIAAVLAACGYAARPVDEPSAAHIRYAPGAEGNYCVPPAGWDLEAAASPQRVEGLVVPSCAVRAAPRATLEDVDPFRVAHFLLTGRHERGLEQPGQSAPGAAIAEWGVLETPVVDRLAARLASRLAALPGLPQPRPRWPHGRRWALALSHDCDRPERFDAGGYARDALGFLRAGRVQRALGSTLKAGYSAAARMVVADPYLRSALEFARFEREHELRGTYFIGVWGRHDADADATDLGYNSATRSVQRLAGQLREAGMELGLHSGIRAWEFADRYGLEAQRFADAYGVRPAGVRAHYWSLRPGAHEESLARIARAGFTYDSSFGMNERAGFRRGTAYPFAPFDPASGTPVGLVEVPPVVMDDALLVGGGEPLTELRGYFETVRDAGGLLVLNWHSDALRAGRWSALSSAMLGEVARVRRDDASCWFCSMGEAAHWVGRERFAEVP
jgi:hypothetical protein